MAQQREHPNTARLSVNSLNISPRRFQSAPCRQIRMVPGEVLATIGGKGAERHPEPAERERHTHTHAPRHPEPVCLRA
eukprot:1721842-Alexandrium_andersonii.AAC.1